MAVSFIGGGIFQTCRKPPTNFILDPKVTQLFSSIFQNLLYIKFLQTTDFKSKIQFYMTKTNIMSEAANLLICSLKKLDIEKVLKYA
jgi:hypothetical protein